MAVDAPLDHDLSDELGRLRRALRTAGFTEPAVRERLGPGGYDAGLADVPLVARRAGTDSLATLLRLFLLELPAPVDDVRRAIGPDVVEDLLALHLVVESDGQLVAQARLVPHGELLLASDRFRSPGGLRPDHVSGFTPTARLCANLTARGPVRTALDLGTGCGTQALLAAAHSEHVVATDVNPRALAFAAFNLRLNEIDNVELRPGSLFEPVAGERFDLVFANAPFVISPETRYAFRDGGMSGDEFSARLVAETPAHLEGGGLATLLVSWLRSGASDPFERPRRWVEGSGCDTWLISGRSLDPLDHAAAWNDSPDLEQLAGGLDSWVRYLRELGADFVVEGAAVLHRRSGGRNWVRADTAPSRDFGPAGEHVRRVIAANDRLVELDNDALLDSVVELTEAHRFEASFAARHGEKTETSIIVRLVDGLPFSAELDADTADLLVRLDGRITLREALVAAAGAAGVHEAGVAEFARPAAAIARELLGRGMLVFAGGAAS